MVFKEKEHGAQPSRPSSGSLSRPLSRLYQPRNPLRVLRWVLTLAVTFIGLLAVTFVIGRKVPIDPVLAILGDRASASAYAAARVQLGLDKPLAEQFLIYVNAVLHGDLGVSLLTANPVLDDIRRVFPATLELATLATSTARARRRSPDASVSRSRRRASRWSTTARCRTAAARSISTTKATRRSAPR